MRSINWPAVAAAAYFLGAVACFGPATVQSERAQAAHASVCEARYSGDTAAQSSCRAFGPQQREGVIKAAFWPLWLSYTIASEASK